VLFGSGMVLAGGCGAGSIWRAGEGHVKLWLTVLWFALGTSAMRVFLTHSGLIGQLGTPVFLPNVLGWTLAMFAVIALMIAWYLVAARNKENKQAGVLKF
jgi:uncharacterized protein